MDPLLLLHNPTECIHIQFNDPLTVRSAKKAVTGSEHRKQSPWLQSSWVGRWHDDCCADSSVDAEDATLELGASSAKSRALGTDGKYVKQDRWKVRQTRPAGVRQIRQMESMSNKTEGKYVK